MGDHNINRYLDEEQLRRFTAAILRDVRALEYMLENNLIETGKRRIGAEQEMFLIDEHWHPAMIGVEALEKIQDDHYTSELTKFNLEFNCDPLPFEGKSLSQMEDQIQRLLTLGRNTLKPFHAHPLLIGILPTITLADLSLDNLTPNPRYYALNESINRLRGGELFEFQIRGEDELLLKHDSVMLEGCNTSFQCHFQVGPEEFAKMYNISQAVTAPVMAVSCFSPILFGKRLWRETRIALFQQSIDTRSSHQYLREMSPRVHFGNAWVNESVLEIYKEDIARFRVIMADDNIPDPWEAIEKGEVPKLRALQLHYGTVYRWNRACYGVGGGKAHLRIENRVIPSGPTPVDEMANAAFWFGLINGMADAYPDVRKVMRFDDARGNFMNAARYGLGCELIWLNGKRLPAAELISNELIPLATQGLKSANIVSEDIDRYMGILSERVASKQTGAQWLVSSFNHMEKATRAEKMNALVASTLENQKDNQPVHTWPLANPDSVRKSKANFARVEQYMTTDLITVNEEELIDLVASLMVWRKIRYILVEDNEHKLVGMVSQRSLLKYVVGNPDRDIYAPIPVKQVMTPNPVYISPETSTVEAISIMQQRGFSALPVVRDEMLVGIVTENDFMKIASGLMEQIFAESGKKRKSAKE
ncbi:MAG: CBS domain-containing protein [Bacteroidetes Order II. Incertae sedis bacterium]|nr:CBS domain-containing protein [Bacteroidetes Order II. bacterium]